jgi:hypothetical protein
MSNPTHGGQREGAGRPQKTEFEPVQEPQTPLMWLWKELATLNGQEVADRLHLEFNKRHQDYQKSRIANERQRRGSIMYTIIVKTRKPGATAADGSAGWNIAKVAHPSTKQKTILFEGTRYDVEWYTICDGNVYVK